MSNLVQVYFCDGCRRVVAELNEEGLVVRETHGRERHETLIPFQRGWWLDTENDENKGDQK